MNVPGGVSSKGIGSHGTGLIPEMIWVQYQGFKSEYFKNRKSLFQGPLNSTECDICPKMHIDGSAQDRGNAISIIAMALPQYFAKPSIHGGTTEEGNCSYLLLLSHRVSKWCIVRWHGHNAII